MSVFLPRPPQVFVHSSTSLTYVVSFILVYMELKGLPEGCTKPSSLPYLTDTTEPTPHLQSTPQYKTFHRMTTWKGALPKFPVTGSQWDGICREVRGDWGKALCVSKYFRQETSETKKFSTSKTCHFRKERTVHKEYDFHLGKGHSFFLSSSSELLSQVGLFCVTKIRS